MNFAARVLLFTLPAVSYGQVLYVAGFAAKRVYRTSMTERSLKAIAVPAQPYDAVLTADGAFLYVSHPTSGTVSVIQTRDDAVVAYLAAPSTPRKLAIGNGDTRLYVANNSAAAPHVTAFDIGRRGPNRRNSPLWQLDLTSQGAHAAYGIATFGTWLAVGTDTGHVLVYDTTTDRPHLLAKASAGARVIHLAFSTLGTKVYALLAAPSGCCCEGGLSGTGNVHVFRLPNLERKAALPVGVSPLVSGIMADEHLYVADSRGAIHVIDVGRDKVENVLPVGGTLTGVYAAAGRVFAVDASKDLVRWIAVRGHQAPLPGSFSIDLEKGSVPVALVAFGR